MGINWANAPGTVPARLRGGLRRGQQTGRLRSVSYFAIFQNICPINMSILGYARNVRSGFEQGGANMFKKTSDKRVAAFFAEGLEECEGLVVCDLLYRAGIRTDKVSISDNLAVTSSHEVTIVCDRTIHDDDFSFDDYDLLFLPGGMPGSNNLRACELLCNALRSFASAGKDVAAVCAAPYILAELGLLKDRRATSNPGPQHVLTEHGAKLSQDPVVVDGNLITSQGLGTSIELGLTLVGRYLGDEAVESTKDKIVYMR